MSAFLKSFACAAAGFACAVKEERNLRFHLCIGFYALLFSLFYDFSFLHYALLIILIAGVISLELVNAGIERVVDGLVSERHPLAGQVKDIAAAAVLVFCIGAAACGILLFWDIPTFRAVFSFFWGRWPFLGGLFLSFILSCWFVFFYGRHRKGF